jgi:hypothetical protein
LRDGDNGDLGRYIQSFQPLNFCLKLSIENMFSSFRQAKRNRNGTQRVLGGWRFPGRFAVSLPGPGNSIWRYLFILFLFCYFLPAVFLRHNQKCGRIFWPCPFPISKPSAV